MSILSNKRREEVETVIRSCLIARQGDMSIQQLNRDYEEFEGEPIPYKEFNCTSLISFLESLPNVLKIVVKGGHVSVHQVDSEKSRHVSSLVEGQKSCHKKLKSRSQRPYFGLSGGRPQVSINSNLMMALIKEVNLYPNGINIDWAIQYVNKISRPIKITRSELEHQLREVSHEIVVCGNNLYPARRSRNEFHRRYIPPPRFNQPSSQSSSNTRYQCPNDQPKTMPEHTSYFKPTQTSNGENDLPVRFTGEDEDAADVDDEIKCLPTRYSVTPSPLKKVGKVDRRPFVRFIKDLIKSQAEENRAKNNAQSLQNGYKDQQSSRQNYEDQQILNQDTQNSYKHRDQDSYQETADPLRDSQRNNSYKDSQHSRSVENSSRDYQNSYRDQYERYTHRAEPQKSYEESQRVSNVTYDGDDYGDDNDIVNGDDMMYDDYEGNRSLLINKKTRERLAILIQSCPEGIWCADLPQKYLEVTGVTLNYMELGFDSVREYASQLPEIFHCIRPTNAGDYKLYNAQKPPPDLCKAEQPSRLTLAAQYHIYDDVPDEPEVFPGRLDPSTTGKLIPEGVMEIKETVGHISVTELGRYQDYEEVEVSEVFTPSFFWIQLRKKLPKFRKFMDDLHSFYENNKSKYKIPLIILESGLNVACIYAGKWHRGIIKTVLPDGRSNKCIDFEEEFFEKSLKKNNAESQDFWSDFYIILCKMPKVHFYDYGTVKSYGPDDLYFLHRHFSYLPAQAIPCGLYNVKPYNNATRWDKSITWEFVSKTSVPLIATIGHRDEEENSLLVTLTDTRGEEDFHINDWMYAEKYADQGRMVCIRNRNFAFSYYTECLKRKGYDPTAIHNCAEFDVSNTSDDNDHNANAKNSAVSLSRENRSINEIRNLKEPEDASEKTLPRVYENSLLIEKYDLEESENASRNLQYREHYNLRELGNSVGGRFVPCENSPRDEVNYFKTRSESVYKDSTHRDYKFLKSDRVSESNSEESSSDDSHCERQFNKEVTLRDYKFLKSERVVESKYKNTKIKESKPESETVESKIVESKIVETKPEEFSPGPQMLKRTLALLAQYETKQEKENATSTSSPSRETSSSSGYKKTSESTKNSQVSNSVSSVESESKIEMLNRFMMKKLNTNKNYAESSVLVEKPNLYSKDHGKIPQHSAHITKFNLHSSDQVKTLQHSTSVNLDSKDQVEVLSKLKRIPLPLERNPPAPLKKPALDSKDNFEDLPKLNSISSPAEKPESFSNSDMSDSDSIPVRSPLLLKENPEEKKEVTFFGTLKSECGGSGRMEPVDWAAIRTAVVTSERQFSTVRSQREAKTVDLSLKISKRDVPLVKPEIMFMIDSDPNSTYCEKDVKFLPAGNIEHSRTSISPLLKLKQRLYANSYKSSSVLISSKLVSILKGELQNIYEDDEVSSSYENGKVLGASENPLTEEEIQGQLANYTVPTSTEEKKPEVRKNDVSGLKEDFVLKQIEFNNKFANKLSQSSTEEQKQPEPESRKKTKSEGSRSKSNSPDLPRSPGMNEDVEKNEKFKSSDVEEELKLLNKEEPKSLGNEGPNTREDLRVFTIEDSQILTSGFTKDFATSINGFALKKNLSNLEEHQKPILFEEEEEPELKKLVGASHELTNEFEKKDQSILNLIDYPSVKTTRSLFFERLNNMKSPISIVGSLDSDDLSSLDDKYECLMTEYETILVPATNLDKSFKEEDKFSTEKNFDLQVVEQNQNSESKIEKEVTPIANVNESLKGKVLVQELDHENSEIKVKKKVKLDKVSKGKVLVEKLSKTKEQVDNNEEEILLNPQVLSSMTKNIENDRRSLILESEASSVSNHNSLREEAESKNVSSKSNLEEAILPFDSKKDDSIKLDSKFSENPVPNQLTGYVSTEYVFNDLDVTSEDEEEWDVMSYMSSESYRTDPVFRLSKNYRRSYNQMVEDHRMQIEEIPNEDNNDTNSKVSGLENSKNSKEDVKPPGGGIVPPNFKYPDEMKLPERMTESVSSRCSSPDRVKTSMNGNNQNQFVNFQYTPEMKPKKRTKNPNEDFLSEEPCEKAVLSHSPSLDSEDFMLNLTEISTPVEKWEPPGRMKSLKNMLLQMSQQ